eukprot:5846480-Pleurochrysis_carterae.AAC.1
MCATAVSSSALSLASSTTTQRCSSEAAYSAMKLSRDDRAADTDFLSSSSSRTSRRTKKGATYSSRSS